MQDVARLMLLCRQLAGFAAFFLAPQPDPCTRHLLLHPLELQRRGKSDVASKSLKEDGRLKFKVPAPLMPSKD